MRRLHCGGDRLEHPVVWTEDFSRCDARSATVRWSDFEGVAPDGRAVRPTGLKLGYQTEAEGGCSNTTSRPDGDGVVQVTNVPREWPAGAVLAL